jgi:hypothetical protein
VTVHIYNYYLHKMNEYGENYNAMMSCITPPQIHFVFSPAK